MIGLAATAIVGLAGTIATVLVAFNTASNQADQSKEQFQRERRVAAYSDLLDATDKFKVVQGDINVDLGNCTQHAIFPDLPHFNDYKNSFNDIQHKANVVAIVGSDAVIKQSTALVAMVTTLRDHSVSYCATRQMGIVNSELGNSVFEYEKTVNDAQAVFTEASREDLK
jgi:hypothetical protein